MNVAETNRALRVVSITGSPAALARARAEVCSPVYTVREFVDDQTRLLRWLDAPGPFKDRVEHLDGWYLVLRPETMRLARRNVRAFFQERFGPGTGALRLTKFLAISRFLDERRADIVRSGLSMRGDPLTVREEFVRFLVSRYTRPGEAIPEGALARFLDEWGHRWI